MTAALLRPIEIHDDNKNFRVEYNLGGMIAVVLSTGVYASILTLITEIETQCKTVSANATVYLDSSFKVTFAGSGTTFTLDWTDQALGRMLGFTGNLSGEDTYTATYAPQYCWLPLRETSDNNPWLRKPVFKGSRAANGLLSGFNLAPIRQTREIQWPAEQGANVYKCRATTSYTWTSTYYPEQERCLEQFVEDVQGAAPSATTGSGLNMKGFYFVCDRSVYTGTSPTVAIPSSMNSGGVDFVLSSSPDRYVYCTVDKDSGFRPAATIPTEQTFFDVGLNVETASAPTWSQP